MIDRQRAYKQSLSSVLDRLDHALRWVGLDHGRVASYKRLIQEYSNGERSDEHFFAYHQAMEALTIFDSWKDSTEYFPGLQERIAVVFKKGSILSQEETTSSNRPRNDGFVYIIGGKFLHGNDAVVLGIDGIKNGRLLSPKTETDVSGDLLLDYQGSPIRVECKRPMTSTTIRTNIERAFDQITSHPRKDYGVIAVDVSKLIEQAGQYLGASTLDSAANYLTDKATEILLPFAREYNQECLLGFIGFASIPLVATARSLILQADGTPFETPDLRSGGTSWVSIKNSKCPKGELLRDILTSFMQTKHDIPVGAITVR